MILSSLEFFSLYPVSCSKILTMVQLLGFPKQTATIHYISLSTLTVHLKVFSSAFFLGMDGDGSLEPLEHSAWVTYITKSDNKNSFTQNKTPHPLYIQTSINIIKIKEN